MMLTDIGAAGVEVVGIFSITNIDNKSRTVPLIGFYTRAGRCLDELLPRDSIAPIIDA